MQKFHGQISFHRKEQKFIQFLSVPFEIVIQYLYGTNVPRLVITTFRLMYTPAFVRCRGGIPNPNSHSVTSYPEI